MWKSESSGSVSIAVWVSASSPPRASNRLRAISLHRTGECREKSSKPFRLQRALSLRQLVEAEMTEEEVNPHKQHTTSLRKYDYSINQHKSTSGRSYNVEQIIHKYTNIYYLYDFLHYTVISSLSAGFEERSKCFNLPRE